jgi:hypothetical protein
MSKFHPIRKPALLFPTHAEFSGGVPGSESGQGLTEYLVLLLLIAVISIGAARTLGNTIRGKLQMAERHIEGVQLENR